MLTREAIKNRAIVMGITTGQMPDVEFIWTVQKADGVKVCFGRGLGCQKTDCRWRRECLALDYFAETRPGGRDRKTKEYKAFLTETTAKKIVG